MALTKAFPRMIEGVSISVKDFGAVGDGVTDDTAAIQAAIDTGNEVNFPEPEVFYNIETDLTVNVPIKAGLYRIFGGNGNVTFNPSLTDAVYPEWWGAQRDGATDDTAPIQKAIDSGCNKVLLSRGTYLVDTESGTLVGDYALVVNEIDNLIIEGENGATLKTTVLGFDVINIYSSENVIIKNINFLGENGDGSIGPADVAMRGTCIKCSVVDCVVTDSRHNGLTIEAGYNCSLVGNRIVGANRHSIYLSNSFDAVVDRNYVETQVNGVSIVTVRVATGRRMSITNNILIGDTFGIELVGDGSEAAINIEGNLIKDTANDAITQITGSGVAGVNCTNNRIINPGSAGLFSFLSDNWNISNNLFSGCGGESIYVRGSDGTVIADNIVIDAGTSGANNAGILLTSFTGPVNSTNCSIVGNIVIEGTGTLVYGIRDFGVSTSLRGNRVTGASNNYDVSTTSFSDIREDHITRAISTSGNSTFTQYSGSIHFVTPSASINYNPSGSFRTGHSVWIVNKSGANTITFDSSGLNSTVGTNARSLFVYDGTNWLKLV